MNHELAKTLTTALVQFIDRERPEGTMDCSNVECTNLENAFNADNYPYIDAFIKNKLTKFTEFEAEFDDAIRSYRCEEFEGDYIQWVKHRSKKLIDIVRKEYVSGMPMPEDTVIFQKGVEEGRRLEREEMRLKFYGNTEPVPTVNGPLCLRYGGICSNPMRDCINCNTVGPVRFNTNTSSGTSTLKAEG